jgi:Tfp pilus assembly protein PilF
VSSRRAAVSLLATLILVWPACRRTPKVPEPVYREAVVAFFTALAAMQTSQETLAREKLARLVEIVPDEPAGWANLGLLALRQNELDEAAQRLAKAAELAPKNAHVQRLLGLLESRRGRLPEATAHLKRAVEHDPADLKSAYALALETERLGGPENEAEAQRLLEALLARGDNLAVRLEVMRLAAKRGDAPALEKAMAPLDAASLAWPEAAREQLGSLREAARGNARAAAPQVAFLRNVLVREMSYRRSLAVVQIAKDQVGEPVGRFLVLPNPTSRPAPPDASLSFAVQPLAGVQAPAAWAGAVWLEGEGAPHPIWADVAALHLGAGVSVPFPGGGGTVGPDGVLAADLNYDFKTDLVLAGRGGVRLFRQEAPDRFTDLTTQAALAPAITNAPHVGAWAADFDTDGDLDVVLGTEAGPALVLRNNNDGTFAERRPFAGASQVRGFAWVDLDGEGVPDAALLEASGRVRVFRNLRGGDFQEETLPGEVPHLAAIIPVDFSGDGILDLAGLTPTGGVVAFHWKEDGSGFQRKNVLADGAAGGGFAASGARLLAADLDNNGGLDLVASSRAGARAFLSDADGNFSGEGLALAGYVLGATDLDGDGRIDLIGLDASSRPTFFTSKGTAAYHWQAFRPRAATATGDQRINSFGIGGEVEVRSGLIAQKRPIAAPVVHIGLGQATSADVVRITWPNGVLQSEFNSAADQVLKADQRLKGSCPWLFAWNGREMAFVTDFIWRSPLGLRINAQVTADVLMTEDRVLIRGDQVVPRDGFYDLRLTAELWETHFFDHVSLLAVDHSVGTEVYVDERFAIPSPSLEVVAVAPPRPFASARDDRGRDVAATVLARDGEYLDGLERGPYQGVTREHYVEVELPAEAPRAGPLYLLASGWIHPTDSSVNVALSQGAHSPPRGLSLWVERGGRWVEARPGLGFPAGKSKTIVLDLVSLFPPGTKSRRLRLATNLEIFWDRLAWAPGAAGPTPATHKLDPAAADLRSRGYSVTEQRNASSPELPRYVLAGTAPRWLDLEGYYTRFGDVRELLRSVDDRYVIMNAGDEMAFRFPALPPPGPGIVRDFVAIGDGWVKDGDFNTTFSRTVLPLPTHASGRYDTPPRALEDDPMFQRHRRDWVTYHTRYESGSAARDALRQIR